jgi:hypothetical protein
MYISNQQAVRASRPRIMVATCWLAAGIAVIAFSERVYAAPHGGDNVAFAPPVTTPDAESIRVLVYRQDPLGTSRDLDVVPQRDSLGVDTGTASFHAYRDGGRAAADTGNSGIDADPTAARQDPNILTVSSNGHRMRSKRPKASHSSRFRHTSENNHTDVRADTSGFVTLAAG